MEEKYFTKQINSHNYDEYDDTLIYNYNKAIKKYSDRRFTFWICYAIFKTSIKYILSGDEILSDWNRIFLHLKTTHDKCKYDNFHLTQFNSLTKEFDDFKNEEKYTDKIKCVEMLEYALHSYYLIYQTTLEYRIECKLFNIFRKVLDYYNKTSYF